MFPISDLENIKAYNASPKSFLLSHRNKEAINILWQNKKRELNNFFKTNNSLEIKKLLEQEVLVCASKITLLHNDFHEINNKTIPVLKSPSCLQKIQTMSNKEILTSMLVDCKKTDYLNKFLVYCKDALSNIRNTDSRYGSDLIDGHWRILGKESKRVMDLMYLSHELGHCVYNSLYGCNNFIQQVKSETSAYIFEFIIAQNYLSHMDFDSWLQYKKKVDLLNKYLLLLELALIDGYEHLSSMLDFSFFDEYSFLLIESFWTSHGYYLVYFMAEKLMLEILQENNYIS